MDLQRTTEMREDGKRLLRRLLSGQYGVTEAMEGNGTQGAWRVVSLLGHLSQELRAKGKHLKLEIGKGTVDEEGRSPEYAEVVKAEQADGINDHGPEDPLPREFKLRRIEAPRG